MKSFSSYPRSVRAPLVATGFGISLLLAACSGDPEASSGSAEPTTSSTAPTTEQLTLAEPVTIVGQIQGIALTDLSLPELSSGETRVLSSAAAERTISFTSDDLAFIRFGDSSHDHVIVCAEPGTGTSSDNPRLPGADLQLENVFWETFLVEADSPACADQVLTPAEDGNRLQSLLIG